MGRHRLVPALAALLLVAGVFGSADAAPMPAHRGFGGSATTTAPPGGAGYVSSDTIKASIGAAQVAFHNAGQSDEAYAELAYILAAEPTPARRVLACAFLSRGLDFIRSETPDWEVTVEEQVLGLAAAKTCVRLAQAINAYQAGARPVARAGGCLDQSVKIKASYEHSASGWTIVVDGGKLRPAGKASDLRTTCRAKGKNVTATLRPKKKGASLRSAVGKNLHTAVVSPPDAENDLAVKVTFKAK